MTDQIHTGQTGAPTAATSAMPPPPPMARVASTDPAGQWQVGGAPVSSVGKRFGAYLLEFVLCMVTLVIGWFIWSIVVWSKGQTPAKSLLGMRCVRTDTGQVASWGTMCLREFVGKGIIGSITFGLTTLVSCFMIMGSSRQGVWDKVATTVVVDDPEGRLLPGA